MSRGSRFFSEAEGSKHVSRSALHAHRGGEIFFSRGMFITERVDEDDTGKPILLGVDGRIDSSFIPAARAFHVDSYDGILLPSNGVAVSVGIATTSSATTANDYIQIARLELSGNYVGAWIQLRGLSGSTNREAYPCEIEIQGQNDGSGVAQAPIIHGRGNFINFDFFVYLESDGGGSGIHYYKIYYKSTGNWQSLNAEVKARNSDAADCGITVWQTGNNEAESTPTGTLYQISSYYDDEFINLVDTPSTYTGQGGKYLRVDSTPDAIEFVDIPSSDLPAHASLHETGGGDAIDHGSIDGLTDDDHTQYYNATRHTKAVHDALALDHGSLGGLGDDDHGAVYYTETEINAALDMTNRVPKINCIFRAYASAAQDNITDNSWTTVVVGTENYDRGSNFASSTFTAPVTGFYELGGMIGVHDLLDVVSGDIEARFLKNGSAQITHYVLDTEFSTASRVASLPLLDQVYLAANDTVVMQVKNNYGGSNLMDITTGSSETFFWGRLIAT